MGYKSALEAAGAEVLDYRNFGDWQGTWIAEVNHNGQHGFVVGCYGSCDHCDAFEAEFGYMDAEEDDNYQDRLKKFGERYLFNMMSLDEVKHDYKDCEDWDHEGEAIRKWLDSK